MYMEYDVAFVLAEVNADLIRWREDDEADGGFKKVSSHKTQYVTLYLISTLSKNIFLI